MEAILRSYGSRNVFFVHILGGDEDEPNLHFKKHYRLAYPVISDNLDRYRHLIRVSGITNVAVFAGDGTCAFNRSFMGEAEETGGFEEVIDAALAKLAGPDRKKMAFVEGGTVYAPEVRAEGRIVHERMPCLTAGPAGELHLAYVSDEKGTNDVMLRSYARGRWRPPAKVAASDADEYAPSAVALGKGLALVAYVSDAGGRYDIYTTFVKDGRPRKTLRVTRSPDDAMAPSLAPDGKGGAWLTWYEWARMGSLSRDREVFAARLEGTGWSRPVQVSPRDVLSYEDHADPVVAADGRGGAWVAWVWDYHGTLRKRPPVAENSVFARHLDGRLEPGEVLAAGFRGAGRARDYVPSLALSREGIPWVAWDNSHKSSLGYGAKAVFVNRLQGDDFAEQVEAAASRGAIDSPQLLRHPQKGLYLLWGEETGGRWRLRLRGVEEENRGEAMDVAVPATQPRYPSGCFDSEGRLWVAATDAGKRRWTVQVQAVR